MLRGPSSSLQPLLTPQDSGGYDFGTSIEYEGENTPVDFSLADDDEGSPTMSLDLIPLLR